MNDTAVKIGIAVVVVLIIGLLGLPVFAKLAGSGLGGGQSPERLARVFLETANAGNLEGCRPLLTRNAWDGFRSGYDASGEAPTINEVGKASISGDSASVPVQATMEGSIEAFDVLMRREDGRWRVYGMTVPFMSGTSITLDFENPEAMMGDMMQEFGSNMSEVFSNSEDEWF